MRQNYFPPCSEISKQKKKKKNRVNLILLTRLPAERIEYLDIQMILKAFLPKVLFSLFNIS